MPRGLRIKLYTETRVGESLIATGRICEVPVDGFGRKKDRGKIGHLHIFFDGEKLLRLVATDFSAIQSLAEIIIDAKQFEIVLAKAKQNPKLRDKYPR